MVKPGLNSHISRATWKIWSSSILKCLQPWDSLILCFLSRRKSNFNKIKRKWAMIYENGSKLGCFQPKTFRKAFFAIWSLRNEHLTFPFSPVATGTVLQWKERNGAAVLPCPSLIRLLHFADFPFQIRFTQVVYAKGNKWQGFKEQLVEKV